MYQINFYVPETHLKQVKTALFEAGAGQYKGYECCAWEVLGTGQYRPKEGAEPFLGEVGEIICLPEYRVEMICQDKYIEQAIKALKSAHPYETPAFSVLELVDKLERDGSFGP